jgi:hypothetical protein
LKNYAHEEAYHFACTIDVNNASNSILKELEITKDVVVAPSLKCSQGFYATKKD